MIDRAYVRTYVRTYIRTYASTDCTGGVGKTIKRKGGVSQGCVGKSTSLIQDFSGALAREARSGAPWVTKCGKLPIRENLVIT